MSSQKKDKPKRSERVDDDNELMESLARLVECERTTRHDPHGFIKYKVKVKETLEILLSKLERNHLYEKYLETEIDQFEDRMTSSKMIRHDLDEIKDEDVPALPTDERIDSADSVEIIHRHTVSQLQDTIHELRLQEFTRSQAYENRIEHLERQLNERESELIECILQKEKELSLAGMVLSSLRKKIDTIGYNIAVRSNLPFPASRLQGSPNGPESNGSHSPLEKYLNQRTFTTEEMLALDHDREHFLSQFENDEEESFYEGCDDDNDIEDDEHIMNVKSESYLDECDGESVDYKNQFLARYDLDDEELAELEAPGDDEAPVLTKANGNTIVVDKPLSKQASGSNVMPVPEVGYEELDGLESDEERDPFCDALDVPNQPTDTDGHHDGDTEVGADGSEVVAVDGAAVGTSVTVDETVESKPLLDDKLSMTSEICVA